MARYIDADKMREEWLENGENEYVYDTNSVLYSIDEQPTVDVVEVVRCKDCKHYHKERHICELFTVECDEKSLNYIFNVENDDYCVKGERRR